MGFDRFARLVGVLCLVLTPAAALAQDQNAAPAEPAPAAEAAPETDAAKEAETDEQPVVSANVAVLRGLDKLTGATTEFEATVGADASFQRLGIKVDACQMRGAENAAFLQIFDSARPEGLNLVFSGWMFASSPALSALDHPRYDVWLQSCKAS